MKSDPWSRVPPWVKAHPEMQRSAESTRLWNDGLRVVVYGGAILLVLAVIGLISQ